MRLAVSRTDPSSRRSTATPPASVLCAPGAAVLTTTGYPSSPAAATAASSSSAASSSTTRSPNASSRRRVRSELSQTSSRTLSASSITACAAARSMPSMGGTEPAGRRSQSARSAASARACAADSGKGKAATRPAPELSSFGTPPALTMTANTGLSPGAKPATACATSCAVATTGGTKTTMAASTRGSARTIGSAASYVGAVAEPSMSTGLPRLASAGSASASAARVSSDSSGSSRPARLAGIGGEDAEAAGVRQDGDPPAAREGLRREQHRGVEELLERRRPRYAGLVEEGVDGGIGAGQRRRVRAGGAVARLRRSTLHRQHRLAPRDPPGEPAELVRIAEGLDVEQQEVGALIVLPVLEQVVRGDVGLVADRRERREPESTLVGLLQERQAERAGLRREADAARAEGHAAQRWRSAERERRRSRGSWVRSASRHSCALPRAAAPAVRCPPGRLRRIRRR